VLGNVISSGIKVLVLAVVIGIGSTLFTQFTGGFGGNQPTIEDAMSLVLGALALLGLGIFGPGIANGIVSGGPQLGAGAAVGPGLAAGGIVAAGAAGAAMGAGAAGGVLAGAARGGASAIAGASSAYRAGGLSGLAQSGASTIAGSFRRSAGAAGSEAGQSGGSSPAGGPPAWATRMKRSQAVSHGASAASQSVRSADHGGGGASVDLSEGER
jgi:type IV secretory pathway TrbL component